MAQQVAQRGDKLTALEKRLDQPQDMEEKPWVDSEDIVDKRLLLS